MWEMRKGGYALRTGVILRQPTLEVRKTISRTFVKCLTFVFGVSVLPVSGRAGWRRFRWVCPPLHPSWRVQIAQGLQPCSPTEADRTHDKPARSHDSALRNQSSSSRQGDQSDLISSESKFVPSLLLWVQNSRSVCCLCWGAACSQRRARSGASCPVGARSVRQQTPLCASTWRKQRAHWLRRFAVSHKSQRGAEEAQLLSASWLRRGLGIDSV